MQMYSVFGGTLESAIEFPELLPTSNAQPTWRLSVGQAPPSLEMECLGERRVQSETYRLWRTPAGFRLEYAHTGSYDISSDGANIVWYPRPDALQELVRANVLGPVLALALEVTGLLCLHGSAVAINGRGVAFLGGKHHGKSTLATALTLAGARLASDDLVAVDPGPPAFVEPGVPSVRLWEDAARHTNVAAACAAAIQGIKTTATGFARELLVEGRMPLDAIYILVPTRNAIDIPAASRHQLVGAEATIALAQNRKLPDTLVGMHAAGGQLRAARKIASHVPVWTLHTARDLTRLPMIVDQIRAWHSGAAIT
jgi:hypothetical protein